MHIKSFLYAVGLAITTFISGCGGGGGDSSSDSFSGDGIYYDESDALVVLVDSTRNSESIMVVDASGSSFDLFISHSLSGSGSDYLETTGVTHISSEVFEEDSTQEMSVSVDGSALTLSAPDIGYHEETLDKVSGSMELEELVGTHGLDGNTWEIYDDGSFIINSSLCNVTGEMSRRGAYFSIDNASTTSCSDASFEGSGYTGRMYTIVEAGSTYMLAVLGDSDVMMWYLMLVNE